MSTKIQLNKENNSNYYTYSIILGVLATLSTPPFFIIALLFVSFSIFYILLQQSKNKVQSFLLGWWFGMGYFSTSLYWISFSLMSDPSSFAWLIPFAIFGVSGFLATFFGLASLYTYLLKYKGLLGLIIFSLSFTIAEWVIGHYLFGGFPWNLLAYSWSFSTEMTQIASIFGVYGIVFATVFCASATGVYLHDKSIISYIIAILLLISSFLYGTNRILKAKNEYNKTVKLRLVQANIKHTSGILSAVEGKEIVNKHLLLTSSPGLNNVSHIIWSESSVPFILNHNNAALLKVLSFTIPKFLITGSFRLEQEGEKEKLYNSLFVVDGNGNILDYYDKHHLVPFGEFIPFFQLVKRFLPSGIAGSFDSGNQKTKNISLKNTPSFTPLICYESIFSGEVINQSNRPQWMINITNDRWFGISSEPYQHLEMSRMRSIEEGIPMIRVANSGISAVINSYGVVLKSLPIMTEGIIDSYLPISLNEQTIYAKYFNNKIIAILITSIITALTIFKLLHKKHKNKVNLCYKDKYNNTFN